MQEQELDMTVELLAESFAESMLLPKAYVKLLAYLVKQYLVERRGFLTDPDLKNLQTLQNFKLFHKLPSGSMLLIRVMQEQELDMTVELLAESFAESMLLPKAYVKLLAYLVKQYLVERRGLMPHAATLIAFHRSESESEGEDIQLAGTVEVSFNNKGANVAPPTPVPPKNAPYICNMTVKKSLRRQGIGWQLLKASEELISQMSSVREVYLHCRMIDTAPFNMYSRAGYSVYKTDSILILLTLQRRKHLMCKQLPPSTNIVSETNTVYNDEKNLAPMDI
ncbi:acyl-CoA N-acyltransferases (NAT) superfamily protein [Artemisia annua]|uniref:Acyl-CoA N-acyltransferases (NAT) superfamily protein n=1 Tax=Artemisia annua TaxID=35608 RepID=A0A2U1LWA9_ARTAN|nr:acyl-CoA N-acyltransferases (NAT) superfamily protein [Artemisia annua]